MTEHDVATVDGVQLHAVARGTGPPLVLLHGMAGGASDLAHVVDGLVDAATVFTYDARGAGLARPVPQHIDRHVADLAAVAATMGSRAVVGGVSMGAAVAERYAATHPSTVRGLVMVAPGFDPAGELAPATRDYLDRLSVLLERQGFAALAGDPAAAGWQSRFSPEGLLAVWRQFPSSVGEVRRAFDGPALVVGWCGDVLHPVELARQWADALPRAALVEVPAADDTDAIVAAVRRFLRDV